MGLGAFVFGAGTGLIIGGAIAIAFLSDAEARTMWRAGILRKPVVLLLDKNRKAELKILDKKNGVYEIDGRVVNISQKDMWILGRKPLLIYYGSLATSVNPELVLYVNQLKSRFRNLKELLKYQYEDEIKKLPVEQQQMLWLLLDTNKKEFIDKIKLLGLKPKEELFEFLIDKPIYTFEDLLDFIQNMRLEYFESAIEKKVLASRLLNNLNIPTSFWIILGLGLVIGLIIFLVQWYHPPVKEVIKYVPINETAQIVKNTTINMG